MTVAAILVGACAGVLAGMLGIGGGALFVPALVLILGLDQVDAEATSLLAIIPVAAMGAWRQHGYGNLRVRAGLTLGLMTIPGAIAGVVLVNALPERLTAYAFAVLLVWIAWSLGSGALAELRGAPQPPADDRG